MPVFGSAIKGLDPMNLPCRFLSGEKDNPRGYVLTVGYSGFVSNSANLFQNAFSDRPYNPCSSKCSLNQLYHHTSSLIPLV